MAIKIIKEGKKKLNVYQVTCGRCQYAEHCENFCPKEEVWSNSAQTIVKSKDINWI